MSSSPVLSLLLLLLLVTTTITTAEAAKAKTVRAPPPPSSATSRQAAPSSAGFNNNNNNVNTSLALATPGHSGPTASEILLPAMRTLVGGPLRLLRQLAAELVAFLRAHRPLPLQLYDHRFWGSVATALPARASAYWSALVSMESTCARRTVCDLAELASRRLPKWAQQAVLFYLNAFAETNEYYGVAIAGLTLKNCRASFEDCDVDRFFARLQGNVTEAIKATVGPVGAAFADLVEVASTTMRSIVTGEEREDLRRPQPQPQQDSLRAPAPASRTFEEEAEEEEDEEPVMMGGSGRRPPLPMMASSSSSSGGVMNRLPVAQPSHHFPRH